MNQTATFPASTPPANGANGTPGISHEEPSRHDARSQSKRIQELIERADALPDPQARELVHECLRSLLALYGEGWARVLQLTKNGGVEGEKVRAALINDKLVRSLLLIHGLHPLSIETRLLEALEKIRPYLQSHGGNVELLGIEDDVARLRLQGTCKSCPSSSVTLELAVRQVITEACPDLVGFEVEGVTAQAEPIAPGPCVGAK